MNTSNLAAAKKAASPLVARKTKKKHVAAVPKKAMATKPLTPQAISTIYQNMKTKAQL